MKPNLIGSKYEYFIEQGDNYREAIAKVMNRYGDRAKVLTQKQARVGGFLGLFQKDVVEIHGYIQNDPVVRKPGADFDEERKKILESAKKNESALVDSLMKEFRDLRATLESREHGRPAEPTEHPCIGKVQELLQTNEFTPKYIQEILLRIRRDLSVETLDNEALVHQKVLEWIGDSIRVHEHRQPEVPNVFVLVGPTGVGKTTTIAKLAAMHRLGNGKLARGREVRILTIDNYRIGARQQIETYGEIMEIPVNAVETTADLRKYLDLYRDADVIFIDTIGKSPKDYETLGKMKALLSGAGAGADVHLAMSATTKASDMAEILQQFEPFGYQSVIVTKMDETSKVGSIISALWERRKSMSYVTTGQNVPHDIGPAKPLQLLLQLQGFNINRTLLEERFEALVTE